MATNAFHRAKGLSPGPQRRRVWTFATLAGLLLGVILLRSWDVQGRQGEHYLEEALKQQSGKVQLGGQRGIIYDRHKHEMAMSAKVPLVYADPRKIEDPQTIVAQIMQIMPTLDEAALRQRFEDRSLASVVGSKRLAAFERWLDGGAGAALEATSVEGDRDEAASLRGPSMMQMSIRVLSYWLSQKKRRGVLIARDLSSEQAKQLVALAPKAMWIKEESKRFYPNGALAGALLGFVSYGAGPPVAGEDRPKMQGGSGIELAYEHVLAGRTYELSGIKDAHRSMSLTEGVGSERDRAGHNVVLTLDMGIQAISQEVLEKRVKATGARSGVVVVLDPRTGDLLALAQTPPFNPNYYTQHPIEDQRNRGFTDLFEPGSTIKAPLVALALEKKKISKESKFNGYNGRAVFHGVEVTDTHKAKELTTLETLRYSSNIAAVQIAQRLGREEYYNGLRLFGLGEATQGVLPGEQRGRLLTPDRWHNTDFVTMSYGYSLSASAVQMALAYGALANGGKLMKLRLVSEILDAQGEVIESYPPQVLRQVVSSEALDTVIEGMVQVTTEKGGTGHKARVPGFKVAGKTGTAEIHTETKRGYDKTCFNPKTRHYDGACYRTSFAGFVPAKNPRLVIFVSLDAAKIAALDDDKRYQELKDKRGERIYGGTVAGPVFSQIARVVLPSLGLTPDPSADSGQLPDEIVPEPAETPVRIAAGQAWWAQEGALSGQAHQHRMVDLRGQAIDKVIAVAREWELTLNVEGSGVVVSQRPEAGEPFSKGASLTVVLARPDDTQEAQP